jgi:2,3-bisphosphoglycerate-independent phosphoglycerate mutase
MKKVILIIMDGWGHGVRRKADAIAQANVSFVNSLYQRYPNAELVTFGEDVGLPEGQMGNSEVGHLNIGAGRIVYQELARINKAVREKTINHNEALLNALHYAKVNGKAVHFLGLVSDGGVHSHIDHLKALSQIAVEQGVEKINIHAFLDGRDTDPKGGIDYIRDLEANIDTDKVQVATAIGRYYAMDRDKRWERVKKAYDLLLHGTGEKVTDISAAIEASYAAGITDEFILPMVKVDEQGVPVGLIKPGDVVICFNFRTDRLRELTAVLSQVDMPEFEMKKLPLHYVTMCRYDDTFKGVDVMYHKDDLTNTLGEVLSGQGKTQVRIAETEKYPHVTFFFSGGREEPFTGEKRIMIPSPKVATYDLQPEMSAPEVAEAILMEMNQHQPDFICLNFANADMVGHTGVFSAAIKAVETVDKCVEKIITLGLQSGYEAIIIADHGNSDMMINEDGTPNTAHTKNMVPCFYISNGKGKKIRNGKLADIAPTILHLFGLEPPAEMDGNNLIYE